VALGYFVLLALSFLISIDIIAFTYGESVAAVIIYFLTPVISILLLTPRNLFGVITAFTVSSLIQVWLLPPEIGIPNWSLIDWIWLFLLIFNFGKKTSWPKYFLLIMSLGLVITFSFGPILRLNYLFQPTGSDSTSHLILKSKLELLDKRACVYSNEDGLLQALSGERSFYSDLKSDQYSITKTFIGASGDSVSIGVTRCP
jgi:hypothetical protein